MKTSEPIANVLERYSRDDIVTALDLIVAERPQLKEKILSALETAQGRHSTSKAEKGSYSISEPAKVSHSTSVGDAGESSPSWTSGYNSYSASWRSRGTNWSNSSPRAWLNGELGGEMQERRAIHVLECWSLVILFIFNVLMLSTVAISYYLSIGTGRVSAEDYYISSSIDTGLSHRIGAVGISIAFVAYLLMMILRYVAIKALVNGIADAPRKCIARFSKVALVLELGAACAAIGVGAFNIGFNFGIHIIFAALTFCCVVASIFVQSFIDETIARYSDPGSPRVAVAWRICRWLQCLVALTGLIGMFIAGPRGYKEESCFFELLMAVALFTYYMTWAGSSGTGYIVGFEVFAYNRPLDATTTRLQIF